MVQELMQNSPAAVDISGRFEKARTFWRYTVRGMELVTSAIPFICVLATIIAQILYAGYDPWHEPVSSLVWSPYGALQTAAFYLLGFSVLILAGKLFPRAKARILKFGIVLLALTGIGMVMIGIFPADEVSNTGSITNAVHLNVTSILVGLFPAGCFVMAPKLKECFHLKWVSRYTWAVGIIGVMLMAIMSGLHFNGLGWLGTVERLMILNGLVWVQVVTIVTLRKHWCK